ncbi:RagB/SusD family nutrient uptake outer membrane protein [Flavobacterium quisquiliarum]|uniref:RagB/SusD family nutrient uptake outer membrane protein n=1 Tax=Flavobacterium quisquiliarum TaxID=1834436 RepID=A0ABV8WBC8_9FLAO|nr:RagB/SusD family nutrient uptake outer membrane protein [Flavobacterium quisquiliarum]MBW1654110.1 RagB/SusD family nutrient uptake outer membrane protein [Flavobacterium quisquiliarum]NWL03404.1 RagB/SusD family nutrient uptake outer membrane protein [Flavobacterium collinsii]
MNLIRKTIVGLALVIGFGSCDDYLDKEPLSDYLSSNFYNNEAAIKQGANGAYQGLYMETSQLPFFTLYDMYTPMGIERADNSSIGVNNVVLENNFMVESQWANFYKGVARANTVLEGSAPYINSLSDKAKQYIAEVKVIRATHYHYLTSLYGDVPFFTKSVTAEEQKAIARTPWTEIVDYLLNDLEEASAQLPWQADEFGRIDRSYALGLKARMALYAGSWCKEGFGEKGVKDPAKAAVYFDIAAQTAKRIMAESGRALDPNFDDLFTRAGQLTPAAKKENIFALAYSDQASKKTHYQSFGEMARTVGGQSGRFPTQLLVDTYEMANGKRIDEPGSGYDPKKPFANRDPRLKLTIYTHQDHIIANSGGVKQNILMELYKPTTLSFDAAGNSTSISNLDYTGSVAQYGYIQSGVGYLWRKYNYFNDEIVSEPSYNILMMRYAEILLIYAEAKIELNQVDGTVLSAINEVRSRVNMPGTTSSDPVRLRQLVRRERKVELARETGLHFFDMRRWRTGALENAEKTYGFPLATGVNAATNTYPDGYTQVTADMVPTYGGAGSDRDLNDLALYAAFGSKLRQRDADRPNNWKDRYYLWPIPQTERNKAPWLSQNDGYGQ